MKSFREYLNKKLEDPKFAKKYQRVSDEVDLGLAIAMRREELGLTQRELSERTGIKQPMISRIERGQLPTLPTLRCIAKALSVRVVINDDRITVEPQYSAPVSQDYVCQWDDQWTAETNMSAVQFDRDDWKNAPLPYQIRNYGKEWITS